MGLLVVESSSQVRFCNVFYRFCSGMSSHKAFEPGWDETNFLERDRDPEVQKVVNPVILDDRKYIQNQALAENISKT